MSRLLRQVSATAALSVATMLALAAVAVDSVWTALAAVIGVWIANAIAVQLIVSAARESNEARQRRFAAYLHELDRAAADGRAES